MPLKICVQVSLQRTVLLTNDTISYCEILEGMEVLHSVFQNTLVNKHRPIQIYTGKTNTMLFMYGNSAQKYSKLDNPKRKKN